MKPNFSYALILAAASCGIAYGASTAFTTPVGYVSQSLSGGQFNLIGVNVQNPTKSAGILTGESSTTVTVAGVDWVAILGSPVPVVDPPYTPPTYILELENGTIQEITNWTNAGVLYTPQDITEQVTPNVTNFKLRQAATVSSLFGASNSAGLAPSADGSPTNPDGSPSCDTIQIYNGSGFDVILYVDGFGWYTELGEPAADIPVIYSDGIYVRRKAGSVIDLVLSGEIKTKPTSGVLAPGFNYICAVSPVGLNLLNSGLQNFITPTPDGNPVTSDSVQVQIPGGAYRVCMYVQDVGWYDENSEPADDVVLNSGFLIMNRGVTKPYTVAVPANYASL